MIQPKVHVQKNIKDDENIELALISFENKNQFIFLDFDINFKINPFRNETIYEHHLINKWGFFSNFFR